MTYEIRARLEDLSDLLSDLIKISVAIRKSGLRSRTLRAASYEHWEDGFNKTSQFEEVYLPQVLEHRYGLKHPLRQRLCKAISLRRRRFDYNRTHQQRLSYGVDISEAARLQQPHEQSALTDSGIHTSDQIGHSLNVYRHQRPAKKFLDVQSLPPTKASDYDLRVVDMFSRSSIQQRSEVSSSTFASQTGIPDPPEARSSGKHFQCPYCCIPISRQKRVKSLWRQVLSSISNSKVMLNFD